MAERDTDDIDVRLKRAHDALRGDRLTEAALDLAAAKELLKRLSESERDARQHAGIAYIARRLGDPNAALQHYAEAAEISRARGDILRRAHAVRHLADIHRERGDKAESRVAYEEALSLYRADAEAPPLDAANCLRGYALLCEIDGDAAQARQFWAEARDLYVAVGVEAGVAECDNHLARSKQ